MIPRCITDPVTASIVHVRSGPSLLLRNTVSHLTPLCCLALALATGAAQEPDLHQVHDPHGRVPADNPPTVPGLVNSLCVGTEENAVRASLFSRRFQPRLVDCVRVRANEPGKESPYQLFERWHCKLNSSNPEKVTQQDVCLFYRDGFLTAKALIHCDDKRGHMAIHQQEIATGRQQPTADKELLQQVQWGEIADVRYQALANEPQAVTTWRLRCGTVLDNRTTFAREHEYNVLVLLQNVGPSTVQEEFCYVPLWAPAFHLVARRSDKVRADDVTQSQVWNATPNTERVDIVDLALLSGIEASPELRKSLKARSLWAAAFQLRPGESTYQWFRLNTISNYASWQARTSGFGVAGAIRDWSVSGAIVRRD